MRAHKNKAACFTLWFPNHNNPRYADLFPRLSSAVEFFKVTLSRYRLVRALQFRLWNVSSRKIIYPAMIRHLSNRYETLFTVDSNQISAWPREQSVVVDMDDPIFSSTEVTALNLPQVRAIIVTTEKAKRIFQELGVTRPMHVIPQGVSIEQIDPSKIQDIRARFKQDSDVVIGYHAPTLTMSADGSNRTRSDQDDLDFLFAALEDAREIEPRIKLWLFGQPSEALSNHVLQGRESWVKLFGYVPLSEMLNYVANVDIGVYPRTWTPPPARFSVKIAQFMACRIPVVSRDLDESFILTKAGCGIVCKTQEDFSRALVELSQSAEKRAELGNAGRNYAKTNLEWSVLVPIYKDILMG